jgi:O-antigen ligase
MSGQDAPPASAAFAAGGRSQPGEAAMPGSWRSLAFMLIFLLVWISVQPFEDRGDPSVLEPSGNGNLLNQLAYLIAAAASAAFLFGSPGARLLPVIRPALVGMVLWFSVSILVSADPGQSFRRLTQLVLVMVIATALLQLPRTVGHFAALLGTGVLATLAVCYAGLLIAPGQAIHQTGDFLEPQLAGSWRGVFTHKNEASAAMAIYIFIGLFVRSVFSRLLGGVILVLSTVFLLGTAGKSAPGLTLLTLVGVGVLTQIRSARLGLLTVGVGLALFNLFTLGSAIFEPIRAIVAAVMPDPSYTGRDEIWRFALRRLAEQPITGYGFQAFWRTGDIIYSGEGGAFAPAAPHAHNGYLDIALTTGIPGLVLMLLWLAGPAQAFGRLGAPGPEGALVRLFTRIWLFGLFFLCLESVFFNSRSPIWFMMVLRCSAFACWPSGGPRGEGGAPPPQRHPNTWISDGASSTTKSTGRKNRIIGTVSFGGSAAAFFSASFMRTSRDSWASTRSAWPTGVP